MPACGESPDSNGAKYVAQESFLPNLEAFRNLMEASGYTKKTAFAAQSKLAPKTLTRLFKGYRASRQTIQAVVDGFRPLGFQVVFESLVLPDDASGHTCDRIGQMDLWPSLADVVRQVAIIAGASSMASDTEDARRSISLGAAASLLEELDGDVALVKNFTIPADIDATICGIRTAHLLLRPMADKLRCGLCFMAEELAKYGELKNQLGSLQDSVPAPEEFFEKNNTGFRALLDALDGSVNHDRGLAGLFCSAVALLVDGQPRVSAIYDPAAGVCTSAFLGGHMRVRSGWLWRLLGT